LVPSAEQATDVQELGLLSTVQATPEFVDLLREPQANTVNMAPSGERAMDPQSSYDATPAPLFWAHVTPEFVEM
jgi:hypothetical protein